MTDNFRVTEGAQEITDRQVFNHVESKEELVFTCAWTPCTSSGSAATPGT